MSSPDVAERPSERPSDQLVQLANHHQVATEFWDWRGRRTDANADTLVTVLASLGVAAATPDEVSAALQVT